MAQSVGTIWRLLGASGASCWKLQDFQGEKRPSLYPPPWSVQTGMSPCATVNHPCRMVAARTRRQAPIRGPTQEFARQSPVCSFSPVLTRLSPAAKRHAHSGRWALAFRPNDCSSSAQVRGLSDFSAIAYGSSKCDTFGPNRRHIRAGTPLVERPHKR